MTDSPRARDFWGVVGSGVCSSAGGPAGLAARTSRPGSRCGRKPRTAVIPSRIRATLGRTCWVRPHTRLTSRSTGSAGHGEATHVRSGRLSASWGRCVLQIHSRRQSSRDVRQPLVRRQGRPKPRARPLGHHCRTRWDRPRTRTRSHPGTGARRPPGSPHGQPAGFAVGAASTDSVVPAATGSAIGADSVTPVGRTTITGQWACNTHCMLTEPRSMLAKPPRPR
jgi:hypothetical protein